MNKTDRLKALLLNGYFPEELPPPFNTKDFATYRKVIWTAWSAKQAPPKTSPEYYNIPRVKKIRRNLSIVNPISQMGLAKLISDEWVNIKKHINSSLSIDEVEIRNSTRRAVDPPNFSVISEKKNEIQSCYDFALTSDISRFYGTLYTHAIAWALEGKSWCKINLNNKPIYDSALGVKLDVAVRKGQDNQTLGIPIGPDTSRIISEIIGSSIDKKIRDTHNISHRRAFRFVDDWYLGCDNIGEAEKIMSTLASSCRDYELELNVEKTKIEQCSPISESLWPVELRQHTFPLKAKDQAKSIEHYFAKAFAFLDNNPDQNILDYAIKRTKNVIIYKENWEKYETFLIRSARYNQTVIPTVVQILVNYKVNNYHINMDKIRKFVNDTIMKSAPLAHYGEVAWSLFLCKGLRIKVPSEACELVSHLESSVCALLALDLESRNLLDAPLDKSVWIQSMNQAGLTSSMWLLAYEADLKGWLQGAPVDFVDTHPFFSELKKRKISFYDIKRNVNNMHKKAHKYKTFKNINIVGDVQSSYHPDELVELSDFYEYEQETYY